MMPTLVMAGSARTQATSLCLRADSRVSRAFNSTTRVVSAGFTGRANVATAGDDDAVFVERGEGFVDGAVVAIVENENFRALSDFACDADGEAVGGGGGERELPVGEAEAAL